MFDLLVHKRGCSVSGCLLFAPSPPEQTNEQSDVLAYMAAAKAAVTAGSKGESTAAAFAELFASWPAPTCLLSLLEQDHIDVKNGNFGGLNAKERQKELEFVRPLCLLHHCMRTSAQQNHRCAGLQVSHFAAAVSTMKIDSGCRFPLHDEMPWAAMVADLVKNGGAIGNFFVVSHLRRGGKHQQIAVKHTYYASHLRDLDSGVAVVMCKFCDAIWTSMERHKMHPNTPQSQHQGRFLRQWLPRAWDAFLDMTGDLTDADWAVEAERIKRNHKDEEWVDPALDEHYAAMQEEAWGETKETDD